MRPDMYVFEIDSEDLDFDEEGDNTIIIATDIFDALDKFKSKYSKTNIYKIHQVYSTPVIL